jgi:hypothetical protein
MNFYGENLTPEKKSNVNYNAVAYALGFVFLTVCFIFSAIALRAFILCSLWEWYLVSYFGLKTLSLPVAFGISLIFSYLKDDAWSHKAIDNNLWIRMVFFNIATFVFGWLGTFFL